MGAEGLRLAGEVECASGVCEKAPKVQIGPSNDLVKVDWYELLCCFVQCKLVPACVILYHVTGSCKGPISPKAFCP